MNPFTPTDRSFRIERPSFPWRYASKEEFATYSFFLGLMKNDFERWEIYMWIQIDLCGKALFVCSSMGFIRMAVFLHVIRRPSYEYQTTPKSRLFLHR